jgi:hypothetical protein
MFNKKLGQIGKTITWVVATVIIIMILIVSILVSTSYLGGSKKADFSKQTDILASKSFFAYLLTEDTGGQTVYEQLRDEENLNDFNGNLALNIFEEFYRKDYPYTIWLVIYSKPHDIITNTFFPKPPICGRGISEEIELKENKYLLLTLTPSC